MAITESTWQLPPLHAAAWGSRERPAAWGSRERPAAWRGRERPAATTAPDLEQRLLQQLLPPYSVILHNDDVNDMRWVVESLLKCVPELTPDDAVAIMMTAHNEGRALVITCPLEHAELYQARLQSRGLTVTIEKA